MIEDLKPYAEYKDSGLPWLGKVPAHWEIKRNGSLFQQRNAVGEPDWPILEVSLRTGVRIRQFGSTKRKQVMSDKAKYKCATKGDFVYNMMRMWQGAAGIAPVDGLVSPAYVVAKPFPHVNPAFFTSLFRTEDYLAEIDAFSRGIVKDRNRLYWDQFKQIPTPYPSPAEQTAIVRFLDWANGRLERAIRAKRKVIVLLNEQKQFIIHRAVTCGLDPSVPLKPSGISWLGDIPEHWEVRRLSAVAHFRSGKAHEQFVDEAGTHICVTARFVSTSGRASKRCSRNLCRANQGDVLMVMSDLPNGRALARAYLVRDQRSYAVNQRVCAITARSLDPRLLAYWANRNWHLLRNDDGLNQTHLSNYDFKTMPIVLPPGREQQQIANYLDKATFGTDSTAERLQRECELLGEYHTRLVADVVTGKLDVRAAAARLPDEAALDVTAASPDPDDDDLDPDVLTDMEDDA